MIIQICIGSSCHIKGSREIIDMMQKAVEENHLEDDVTLAGSFCIGKCTKTGVTIQVNEEIFTSVTKENFKDFFDKNILNKESC